METNNLNVDAKMLKDGKRTVIIIEGADETRDELAWQILSTYFGFTDYIPDQEAASQDSEGDTEVSSNQALPGMLEIKGLEPVKETSFAAPTSDDLKQMEDYRLSRQRNHHVVPEGPYKGMTPIEALHKDNEVALVSFFNLVMQMRDCAEREEIIRSCKQYMSTMARRIDYYPDRESKVNCLCILSKMGGLDQIINGYQSLPDFCNYASDSEIDTAFVQTMFSFQERGR